MDMKTQVIPSDSASPWAAARVGAAALRDGKLVGFATETVYGIAVNAARPDALERLRELKSRPARPFSLHVGRPEMIYRYVADPPELARRLIDKALPGPLTLLLPVGGSFAADSPGGRDPALYDRLVCDGVLGVRCVAEPTAQAMLDAVEDPVVAPSANLAGRPSPRSAADVLADLDGNIDLLIDSGPTRYGRDSTIVDFTGPEWRIVRAGVIDERMIQKMLARLYVFVCTGNTCRSPMAEGLARVLLARRLGVAVKDLASRGVEVVSAGIYASEGSWASPEAVIAASAFGADISAHRSRQLTTELIQSADLVFCMTDHHVEQAVGLAPRAASRIVRLDPRGDVSDPIGGDVSEYRDTAAQIAEAFAHRLDRGLP